MVKTLRDEIAEATERMQALMDGARDGQREFTAAEAEEFDGLDRKTRVLIARERARSENGGFSGILASIRKEADPARLTDAAWPAPGAGSSAGQTFVRSDEFRQLLARWPMSGPRSPVVVEVLAATLTSPVTGWPASTQLPPVPPPAPVRLPRVSELFTRATAEGGNVPFVTDASTGTAAPQTEGTPKSEVTLVLPASILPLRTVAAWAKVADQSLEDVGGLASWIDAVLGNKVLTELDRLCLAGTGVAPQLLGLLNVAGRTADYAMPATGSDPATAILHQILAVEANSGFAVDAVVLSPNVYEALLNLKAVDSGVYLSGTPISSSPLTMLWGRTLTYSAALPAGSALVGGFRSGAALFLRGGLRLAMTNSDASDFTANVSTLRAELRAALATWVPRAFGLVTALTP